MKLSWIQLKFFINKHSILDNVHYRLVYVQYMIWVQRYVVPSRVTLARRNSQIKKQKNLCIEYEQLLLFVCKSNAKN